MMVNGSETETPDVCLGQVETVIVKMRNSMTFNTIHVRHFNSSSSCWHLITIAVHIFHHFPLVPTTYHHRSLDFSP